VLFYLSTKLFHAVQNLQVSNFHVLSSNFHAMMDTQVGNSSAVAVSAVVCYIMSCLAHTFLQVGQLTADLVRLVAQLEKGEVIKQNLEFELAKTKRELAAGRHAAVNRETDMTDAVADLQRMFSC
jgi:hypothetical protein